MVEKLKELLQGEVVYVVNDKAEFVLFSKYVGSAATRVTHVSNVDELINEMEKIDGGVTFVFSDKLPEDVSGAVLDIAQIVDNLAEGLLNVVEIGSTTFANSLRLLTYDKEIWMDPMVEVVPKPVDEVLSKPVVSSYWKDLPTDEDEAKEIAKLRKDIDELVAQKMEVESELIKMSESVKAKGFKSDAELTRVTALYEEREERLTAELHSARTNLSEYQKKYAERSNEYEELMLVVGSLRSEIETKTSLIENDLSTREAELTDQLESLQADLLERDIAIKNKAVTLNRIEEELSDLREKLSHATLEAMAQRELFHETRNKVEGLESTIEELNAEVLDRESKLLNVLNTYTTPEDTAKLQELIEQRDIKLSDFSEQTKKLRVETMKANEKQSLAEDELEKLRASYRELLATSGVAGAIVEEKTLGADVTTNVYYFKVISQPLYFKSFMMNFVELLTNDRGNVLTVLIREEDAFTDMYFEGIRRVNTLDDVVSSDKVVMLKPSQIMFSDSDTFYNAYDSIVVVDFMKTRDRYLKTPNGLVIHAFINEKEAEMHGIRGLVLSSGENSIIPMQYNKEIELAITPMVKKKYVQSIVRNWMRSLKLIK